VGNYTGRVRCRSPVSYYTTIPLFDIEFATQFFQFGQKLIAGAGHFFVQSEHSLAHIKDGIRAREVDPKVVGQTHYRAYSVDVALGVEANFAAAALRFDKAFAFVQPERLWVNPEDFSGNADDVAGMFFGVDGSVVACSRFGTGLGAFVACTLLLCLFPLFELRVGLGTHTLTFRSLIIYTLQLVIKLLFTLSEGGWKLYFNTSVKVASFVRLLQFGHPLAGELKGAPILSACRDL
jgi:hypothetical protein